jgi:hypothetical protein
VPRPARLTAPHQAVRPDAVSRAAQRGDLFLILAAPVGEVTPPRHSVGWVSRGSNRHTGVAKQGLKSGHSCRPCHLRRAIAGWTPQAYLGSGISVNSLIRLFFRYFFLFFSIRPVTQADCGF